MRILLLEDDLDLAQSLIRYLKHNGFSIDWARDGEEAIELSYANRYALYLLDINVPHLNGFDLLLALREADDRTPAIIISAQADTASVSQGFLCGADDYLKKPFDPDELLVRIKSRTNTIKKRLSFGKTEILLESGEIYYNHQPYILGEVQKRLLLALARNYPNPVSKEELLLLLDKATDLALRVNISKIKKQLGLTIQNIRGVGYKII